MKLSDPLPTKLKDQLDPLLRSGEKVLFTQKSDLTRNRDYGDSYLVATDRQVIALDEAGEPRTVKLHEITEVKVDELFGSGRLVAVTDAGDVCLVFYSKAYVPEFAVFCRVLNDLAHARKPELPDEEEYAYCPKCGGPLSERGAICKKCLPRFRIMLRLFGLLKPYRRRVTVLIVMSFVTVLSQLAPPRMIRYIIDDVCVAKNPAQLPLWIGLMIGSFAIMFLARLIGNSLTAWLGARIVASLRSRLHTTLQRLRMSYFNGRESGQLIGRVMHDTGELEQFLIDGSSYFFVQLLSLVGIAIMLLLIDVRLTLLVVLPVPFLLGGGRWFWRKLVPLFHKHGTKIGALHSVLGESIRGVKAVKAYSGEKRRMSEFDKTNEGMFKLQYSVEHTFISFDSVMFLIMSLGVAAVWLFGAHRIATGDPAVETLTLGKLSEFVAYIWLFYGPIQWFTAILNWMTHAFTGAERIFGVLDSKEEVYEAPDAVDLPRIEGRVGFERARFSYERGKEVIKGISFDIAPGEMIGLVGKSGVGKSTIINLVCRFFDLDSGEIKIDGHPIQKLKLDQLRLQIGMVMQEPFLFNASIMENIGYGLKGATFDEIVRAARAARAHDFIVAKEDGYDTVVGERGVKLSGGEKQRLAIARAILHDPPILILDEATSSVDTETEKEIQEAMATLIKGRTTIGIAHRLSTLRNANRLIVIDDGKIAETGTHDELIKNDGIYARLVRMQTEISKVRGDVWQE